MKKLVVVIAMALSSCFVVNNVWAAPKDSVKGTWEYQVPSAPYEYSSGQFIVGEADGEPVVTVKFMDGTEIKGEHVKFEKDSFLFGVYINYDYVKVSCKIAGDKLTGEVDSPEGLMKLSAEKKKIKE